MAYRVEFTPRATNDLNRIAALVLHQAPLRGPIWLSRFEQTILSLATFPERCAVDPLLSRTRPVRRLHFGKRHGVYTVYFEIRGDVVFVLHIRHGARKEPKRV